MSTVPERVGLEAWRAIQAQGEAAAKTADLEEQIAACRAYLERYPEHPQSLEVVVALTDALVLMGNVDPGELSRLVERRAALDTGNTALPAELVRTYHKHGLSLDSALAVLERGLRRIALEREHNSYRRADVQKQVRDLTLQQEESEARLVKAWLYLQHGKPRETLVALADMDAERDAARMGPGPDHGGLRLSGGADDVQRVLRAAALQQLGRNGEAREAFASALGFLDDPEMSKLYENLRAELGFKSAGLVVKAPPLPAPEFALKNLEGEIVRLSDYRGEVVLITFWATWCTYCPGEMAELQAFQRQQTVTVLTISIDQFRDRPKIKPFLERFNLELPVLLEEPQQLTGYNYAGIPALYVIDREGRVAHARVGYDPALKDKLANEIREIVTGGRESGRPMLTVHHAPPGYGLRWQEPLSEQVHALAVAPPIGDQPGEIAAASREGLTRWSAEGANLGTTPVSGWLAGLQVADLDGDGDREWVTGGGGLKLFDADWSVYWERSSEDFAQLVGIRDLNGDGFEEIIFHDSVRVTALQADGVPLWVSPPFRELAGVVMGSSGDMVVQADGRLSGLSELGERRQIKNSAIAEGQLLAARVATPQGELNLFAGLRTRFFGGPAERFPLVDADVDGDSRDDVIVAARHGVVAYDTSGATLLHIRGHDVGIDAIAAGDLDGQPGDEVVLFIGQYGLVVLGRTPTAPVVAGTFAPLYRPGSSGYQ